MLPVDSETLAPWSNKTADLKLQDMKSEVVRQLRARDTHKSNGVLCEANGFKTTIDVEGKLRADPHLSAMKHSGQDVKDLVRGRWAAFCSEPRNEKEETAHLIEAQRKASIGAMVAAATDLETELAEIPEPRVRRKPGRPKSTRNT